MKSKLLFGLITIFSIVISSCSLIKNEKSSNFNRVKYNSHVKMTKKLSKERPFTVIESFQEDDDLEKVEGKPLFEKTSILEANKEVLQASKINAFLRQKENEEKIKQVSLGFQRLIENERGNKQTFKTIEKLPANGDWWEDDVEDWPWGEIVLAVIAVLLISIIIVLLVNWVGGVIAGLIGLILLLGLAYFLYEYWL